MFGSNRCCRDDRLSTSFNHSPYSSRKARKLIQSSLGLRLDWTIFHASMIFTLRQGDGIGRSKESLMQEIRDRMPRSNRPRTQQISVRLPRTEVMTHLELG